MSQNREIDQMLNEIRDAIARCRAPSEWAVYDALVSEADGWKMRLQELDAEDE